ncbi:Extradiol ring-cleavage dioxygenase, class III enzyme, subunit B [Phlyctochytrium arcticum]|nr:Extradiol ring-cleavage dioxygenase, class III enzyme, subunit B [Phlyctochytrium arcticum]
MQSSSSAPYKTISIISIIFALFAIFAAILSFPTQLFRRFNTRMSSSVSTSSRAPAIFIPHGGGPMPLLNEPGHAPMVDFLTRPEGARKYLINNPPKAILVVTAHWETEHPQVSTLPKAELYYDYYGFPKETYNVHFPVTGSPDVAHRVVELLGAAGIQSSTDGKRGWDHGVFVPFKVYLGDEFTHIPIIPMSVLTSQDAEAHYKIGQALAPLRDEGIMIVGSGMSFHNMRTLMDRSASARNGVVNKSFDTALDDACKIQDPVKRREALAKWEHMQGAYDSHPRRAAEHLMPLFVVAGAGGDVEGKRILKWDSHVRQSAWAWE